MNGLPKRTALWAVALTAIALATACSSSKDTNGSGDTGTAAAPIVPVAGCGKAAHTDPTNRSAGRPIATCDSGAPAPKPLAKHATITLTQGAKAEFAAPVLLGISLGEFEKENLTVKLEIMPTPDAITQMGAGKVDAANGGPYATFTNAVLHGLDLKLVLANYSPTHGGDASVPQAGLWVRRDAFSDPQHPNLAELKGKTIANTLGNATISVYWMEAAMQKAGASLKDIKWSVVSPADGVTALEQGAVPAAYLLDPFWTQAASQPDKYALLAVQPPEPNGAILYGPNLLEKHRDVGEAFARAYIRTINTYLQPGYHKDPKVVDALAKAMSVPPNAITSSPELRFEWEWPQGLTDDLQTAYIKLGTQTGAALPDSKLVDRSFYNRAVGYAGG